MEIFCILGGRWDEQTTEKLAATQLRAQCGGLGRQQHDATKTVEINESLRSQERRGGVGAAGPCDLHDQLLTQCGAPEQLLAKCKCQRSSGVTAYFHAGQVARPDNIARSLDTSSDPCDFSADTRASIVLA